MQLSYIKLWCHWWSQAAVQSGQRAENRLLSTMLDDWFSALMVLSAEKDLLESLAIDDIISRFARCSSALQKQLVYMAELYLVIK